MSEVNLGALSYEELVELLERLTQQMASGAVGIEEAARLYEQAGRVHAAAAKRLADVTARLEAMGAGTTPPGGRDDGRQQARPDGG